MGVQDIIDQQNEVKEAEIMRFVELKMSGSEIRWHDFAKLGIQNQINLVKQIVNEPVEA